MRNASTSTDGSRRSARVSRLPASRTCERGAHKRAAGRPLLCVLAATEYVGVLPTNFYGKGGAGADFLDMPTIQTCCETDVGATHAPTFGV